MSNIKYDKQNESISKSCKIVRYGKYTYEQDEEKDWKINVIKSIDEQTFYRIYLELNNVIGWKNYGGKVTNIQLTSAPIDLLSHIMMKGVGYTLVFRNKDARLVELGKEINKSTSSVYASLGKLRKAGYIIKDEDNLLTLNKELTDLVVNTKKHIDSEVPLTFDFLFKFCVTD